MTFSRRTMLRFGMVGTAGLALPRLRKARRDRKAAMLLADPLATHTYEEGLDGALVTSGAGVVTTAGSPAYSTLDAVHADLGWVSSAALGGGRLTYENPSTTASSGSVYVTPREFAVSATATVVSLSPDAIGSPALVKVRLRWDGRVELVDGADVRLAVGQAKWLRDQPMRVDWQQAWDGANTGLTVWFFGGANVEGWRPDVVLSTVVPSLSPTFVALGQEPATSASVGFDTYREYTTAGMPAPFSPVIGRADVHSFDEGVDGQVIRIGSPGAEAVRLAAGSPSYSASAAKHGPLGMRVPATAKGGTLRYDSPFPPAQTGSVYLRVDQRGPVDSQVLAFQSGAAPMAMLAISFDGNVSITDGARHRLATTVAAAHLNTWTRLDWQAVWDGTAMVITVRFFSVFAESIGDYEEITASIPVAATPDSLELGSPVSGWTLFLDTLRTYGDTASWPAPFGDPSVHLLSLIGDPTAEGVVVSSMVLDVASVDLAVSLSSDMADAVLVGAVAPDVDHLVRHVVAGRTPSTQHYAQLVGGDGALIGDQLSFRTLSTPTAPQAVVRIALVSCQQSGGPDLAEAGWNDILGWDPDLLLHGGDFGYWGGGIKEDGGYQPHLDRYRQQFGRLPVMRHVLMTRPSLIQISDHETSGNNGDNFDDPSTADSLDACRRLMPIQVYGDVRDPIRGRFVAMNLSANIRLISVDFRSLDRSPGAWEDGVIQSDGSTKSALGQTQMEWLHAELTRPEPLKIILSDPAWGPASAPTLPIPGKYLDKWWSYASSQRAIADIVENELTSVGTPINVDFWGNDRHLLGYLSGPNNPMGHFPVLCGSGMDQHALPLMPGELYDQMFGSSPKEIPVHQYMRIELSDDGFGVITRVATGMDLVSGTVKISAVDTWSYALSKVA